MHSERPARSLLRGQASGSELDTSLHVEDSPRQAAGSFNSIVRNGRASAKDERGRTLFEALLALILVSVFILIAIDRYASSVRRVKEVALTVELNTMRSAVNYYAVMNGRLPESLRELTARDIMVARRDITGRDYTVMIIGKYVESMTADAEGSPVDPFGNRYQYDPKTGVVRSGTAGYERW